MTLSHLLAICFFACSIVCWLHVRQIIRDKAVKGVSLIPTFVFMTTNIVEMFYFADRGDWLSMAGGGSMLLSNAVWSGFVFYYLTNDLRGWSFGDLADDPLLQQLRPRP